LKAAIRPSVRGVKGGVFAAYSRRVASTEAKVLNVPALFIRQSMSIEGRCRLIIRAAKLLIKPSTIIRDELQLPNLSWPDCTLSKRRRGEYSGNNCYSTYCLNFCHFGFSYSCCDKPDIGMHCSITVKFLVRNFNRTSGTLEPGYPVRPQQLAAENGIVTSCPHADHTRLKFLTRDLAVMPNGGPMSAVQEHASV